MNISTQTVPESLALKYTADPTKQPGFGAARPRRFNVRLMGNGTAEVSYLADARTVRKTDKDNLLSGTDFPILRFSFLLPGHNLIDVKARSRIGPKGQPYLDLSFDEFLRALRGSIEEFCPRCSICGFGDILPETRQGRKLFIVEIFTPFKC